MNRQQAIDVLRRMRSSLEARGIAHVALFGSMARDEGHDGSDVDVVITPADGKRLDLIDLGGVQTLLEEGFGSAVDVVVEPVRKAELRLAIQQDRADVF